MRKFASALLAGGLLVSACSTARPLFPQNGPGMRAPQARFQQFNKPGKIPAPDVIEIPSPNSNPRPAGQKITAIVLHHTASAANARNIGKFFARKGVGVSAHYTVDRTGYIVRSVADHLRSWHAGRSVFQGEGNVNNYSIGIEICNLGDSKDPYPNAQYDGLIKLVAHLVDRYDIPLERITRHRDISVPAGRKIDTSNNFSVDRLLRGVQQVLDGSYQSPDQLPPQPIEYPAYLTVSVTPETSSFKDLADVHLDNENRWIEIQAANPELPDTGLQPGQQVRIPTGIDIGAY